MTGPWNRKGAIRVAVQLETNLLVQEWMIAVLVCIGWVLMGAGLTLTFTLKINILNCIDLAMSGSFLVLCYVDLAWQRSHFGSPCIE